MRAVRGCGARMHAHAWRRMPARPRIACCTSVRTRTTTTLANTAPDGCAHDTPHCVESTGRRL
jgi:hypothetical protein